VRGGLRTADKPRRLFGGVFCIALPDAPQSEPFGWGLMSSEPIDIARRVFAVRIGLPDFAWSKQAADVRDRKIESAATIRKHT
jgi:hypothetical protein